MAWASNIAGSMGTITTLAVGKTEVSASMNHGDYSGASRVSTKLTVTT